jgi:hypothetical protein
MSLIVDQICQDLRESELGSPSDELIDWRQRYEGVLVVAYLDGKAVAGISGPWPVNQFALTWWDRPMPARQLELFDSLAAAQRRVEEWASRMRTIGVIDRPPANDPILPEATVSIAPIRQSSWLGKLRQAITPMPQPRRSTRPSLEALRHQPLREDDLRDVHFAAVE